MKKNLSFPFLLFLVVSLFISSCGGGDLSKDITKLIPDDALAVVTVHPGNLLEKGQIQELEVLQEAASESDITERILEDPESSGIEMDTYSAFFAFDENPVYGVILMPVKSKKDLEATIEDIKDEVDEEFEDESYDDYTILFIDDVILSYSKNVCMAVFELDGWGDEEELMEVAEDLIDLDNAQRLITDKDFKKFTGRQKDINAWASTTNLDDLMDDDAEDMMDLFGGVKNNYMHVFLEFNKGNAILTTNLFFNKEVEETIDKYNFLQGSANSDLLKYLPAEDLVMAGNMSINTDKIFDLLKFVDDDFDDMLDETADELDMDVDDIKEAFSGEMAMSFNGMDTLEAGDDYYSYEMNLPMFTAAVSMENEDLFEDLIETLEDGYAEIESSGDHYEIIADNMTIYLMLHNNDIIITNVEDVMDEIEDNGKLAESIENSDMKKSLTGNPLNLYLSIVGMDSRDMKEFIYDEFGRDLVQGMEFTDDKVKSITFSANLEEWEVKLEMGDSKENSLYTMLKQFD